MTYSSRDKINSQHLLGSIGIAALLGVVSGSWAIFVLIAAALIGASMATGEIRLPQNRRGRKS